MAFSKTSLFTELKIILAYDFRNSNKIKKHVKNIRATHIPVIISLVSIQQVSHILDACRYVPRLMYLKGALQQSKPALELWTFFYNLDYEQALNIIQVQSTISLDQLVQGADLLERLSSALVDC